MEMPVDLSQAENSGSVSVKEESLLFQAAVSAALIPCATEAAKRGSISVVRYAFRSVTWLSEMAIPVDLSQAEKRGSSSRIPPEMVSAVLA